MFGFLNVSKPSGITSRQVVNHVQQLVRPVKVGHTGTLDPLAGGVLVLGIGPATRLANHVLQHSKRYLADFRLGAHSDTDDLEGTVVELAGAPRIESAQLKQVLHRFTGAVQQVPPAFSAVKVDGKRAYRIARKGRDVELKPRQIVVQDLQLVHFDNPNFRLDITCSSGTYIRAIGRDIGTALGSASLMTALSRVSVGPFMLEDSQNLESLTDRDAVERHLVPPAACLGEMPLFELSPADQQALLNGTLLPAEAFDSALIEAEQFAAVDREQRLLAVMTLHCQRWFKPRINFTHYWA